MDDCLETLYQHIFGLKFIGWPAFHRFIDNHESFPDRGDYVVNNKHSVYDGKRFIPSIEFLNLHVYLFNGEIQDNNHPCAVDFHMGFGILYYSTERVLKKKPVIINFYLGLRFERDHCVKKYADDEPDKIEDIDLLKFPFCGKKYIGSPLKNIIKSSITKR